VQRAAISSSSVLWSLQASDTKIRDATLPWRLNFVRCRLIFVDLQYWTCFM
jgi:hypothetical protein